MKKQYNIAMLTPAFNHIAPKATVRYKTPPVLYGNVVHLYLDSYFKTNYKEHADRFKWHVPMLLTGTEEDLVDYLEEHDIDILGLSLYVWNTDLVLRITKNIKQLYSKDLLIIAGGPNCTANVDPEWKQKYPWIDHSVVGQGEKVWSKILLDKIGVDSFDQNTTTNIVRFDKLNKKVENSFESEFIRNIHFSPYVESGDLLKEMINHPTYKDHTVLIPYETSRGCPYKCSFCDWTSGLHHKVQKRKIDHKEEIDFMIKSGVYKFALADANFGMWKEDVELAQHIADYKEKGYPVEIFSFNMSKTKDDNVKTILDIFARYNLCNFLKISVQDIHQEVLNASDRPDLPWEVNRQIVLDILDNHSHVPFVYVEFIVGLPIQTVQMWKENVEEAYKHGMITSSYQFAYLPGAPVGYNPEIQKKYEMETKNVAMAYAGREKRKEEFVNFTIICKTSTMTTNDMLFCHIYDHLYKLLAQRLETSNRKGAMFPLIKQIVDTIVKTNSFNDTLANCRQAFDEGVFGFKDVTPTNENLYCSWYFGVSRLIKHNYHKIVLPIFKKHTQSNLDEEYQRNIPKQNG